MPLYSQSKKSPSFRPYSTLHKSLRNRLNNRSLSCENLPSETENCTTKVINSFSTSIVSRDNNIDNNSVVKEMSNPSASANQNTVSSVDVVNSLRVPDAIKDLPKFDGNPRLLFDFLDNVDEILSLIQVTSGTPYGQLLLRAIRNKIVGDANEILNMYGTSLNWDQIKENLILHYADKRNETSLIRDLHNLKQNNDSIQKFYSEIVELLSSMNNHVNIHENDNNVITAKKALFAEMCLNTFLSGLREPLGSTIRAMKPETLATAYAYCIKEQNIFYTKSESNKHNLNLMSMPNSKPKQLLPTKQNLKFPQIISPSFPVQPFRPNHSYYPPQPRPGFHQTNFQPSQWGNQFPQRPYLTQGGNLNFQQRPNPFQSVQPKFQSGQNVSTRPGNAHLAKPEPMDISSGSFRANQPQPRQPQNNFFRASRPPNFISEELFNVAIPGYTPDAPDTDPNFAQTNNPVNQPYYTDQFYGQNFQDEVSLPEFNPPEDPQLLNENNNNAQVYNVEIDDGNFPFSASNDQLDT